MEQNFNREELKNRLIKEFDFEDDSKSPVITKIILPLILLIALVSFVGYAWYTDKFAISSSDNDEIPLVRAETEPVRVKPTDPGGMQFANTDKTVFETISNSPKQQNDEAAPANLLKSYEEPVNIDEITAKDDNHPKRIANKVFEDIAAGKQPTDEDFAIPSNNNAVTEKMELTSSDIMEDSGSEDTPEDSSDTSVPTENDSGTPNSSNTPDVSSSSEDNRKFSNDVEEQAALVQDLVEQRSEVKKKMAEKMSAFDKMKVDDEKKITSEDIASVSTQTANNAPAEDVTFDKIKIVSKPKMDELMPSPATKESESKHRIQLGSFKTEGDVKGQWDIIKNKYNNLLGKMDYYTQRADLGDKGIYYRLQAGPVKDEAEGRKICQELITNNQGCFFVKE